MDRHQHLEEGGGPGEGVDARRGWPILPGGAPHRRPRRTDLGKVIPYNAASNKRYLYGEQGSYCNGCEHHFELRHLEVDHIIARSKGGTDHISNLQLLCGACNAMKGTKTQVELLVMLTDKGWIKREKMA